MAENENEIAKRKNKVSKLKMEVNELAKKITHMLNEGVLLKAENQKLSRNLKILTDNNQEL
jgi:regulator of replication initiation timing